MSNNQYLYKDTKRIIDTLVNQLSLWIEMKDYHAFHIERFDDDTCDVHFDRIVGRQKLVVHNVILDETGAVVEFNRFIELH